MSEIYQRPDAALADELTRQHNALGVHQDGLDANVEKMQALNELMNICSEANEKTNNKDDPLAFKNPARVKELCEQVLDIASPTFIKKLNKWIEALDAENNSNNSQREKILKSDLKAFERELSTCNRTVEMDIQTIMNRFAYYKDMLYQHHTIAQSTAKAMERLHEAFLRVGRY
jgi:hypothetical protein